MPYTIAPNIAATPKLFLSCITMQTKPQTKSEQSNTFGFMLVLIVRAAFKNLNKVLIVQKSVA